MNISVSRFQELEKKAEQLKVMGHALRLAIIGLLYEKHKLTVTEIFTTIGIEQAVASHHLRILKSANIVAATRSGKHSYYYIASDDISELYKTIFPA